MAPRVPKFRVLAPEVAKSLRPHPPKQSPKLPSSGNRLHPLSSLPSSPHPPPKSHPTTTPPTSTSSSPFSFFSRLRTRYNALPHAVRAAVQIFRLAPLLPIGAFLYDHVGQPIWVRGPSMTPYLNENYETDHTERDLVLLSMWPFGGAGWGFGDGKRRIERGMVVAIRSPANPSHIAIKRIIGLPGDRIQTREPCLKESQIVPFNHVWLEGDAADPKKTLDSNTYGPVSVSLIVGQVRAVLWPRFRWLDWECWEKGLVEGDVEGRFGDSYRKEVRERVGKGAVQLERPFLT
ncbi:peptidase S24/S26A/S26B/S26C [Aspergillus egyptiacus]|nr:peptidase S24/S26A/S26B/S26C [Aspergillus egyptiacus]